MMLWWVTYSCEKHSLSFIKKVFFVNCGNIYFNNSRPMFGGHVKYWSNNVCGICVEYTVTRKLCRETNITSCNKFAQDNAKLDVFVQDIQTRIKGSKVKQYFNKTQRKSIKKVGVTKNAGLSSVEGVLSEPDLLQKNIYSLGLQNIDKGNKILVNNMSDNFEATDKKVVTGIAKSDKKYFRVLRNMTDSESSVNVKPVLQSSIKQAKIAPSLSNHSRKLVKSKESSLLQLLDDGKLFEAIRTVESFEEEGCRVPFGLIRRLCGCSCTMGQVDIVLRVKAVAKKSHSEFYKKELNLDNYLASALCYSGDYQGSINKMIDLLTKYPKGTKKTRDTAKQIIYHIMKSSIVKHEEMVLKFTEQVAENTLSPALSLWHFCFCSSIYRHQKIAENLTDNHPGLTELLPQKLDNIIKKAYEDGDLELLHRILQLILFHKLTDYYKPATAALLLHQCDIGDINGANETIRFATVMKVYLGPSVIQRYLAVLHSLQRPVPLTLLEMKYRVPPKPVHHSAPKYTFKF